MNLRTFLFGRPIRDEDAKSERLGPVTGVPVLGLDALASAAYGPEPALCGSAGHHHQRPLAGRREPSPHGAPHATGRIRRHAHRRAAWGDDPGRARADLAAGVTAVWSPVN